MRGLRLVRAGEQAVDRPAGPARRSRRGSSIRRSATTLPSGCETVSRARTTVVPTAITRPPPLVRGVHQARRVPRNAEALRVGRLVALLRGDAGVQHDRRDEHAPVTSRVISSGRERAPGAGHLGAAGLGGVDGLVGGQRPASRHVAVADRVPVLGEVGRDRPAAGRVARPRAAERRTRRGSVRSHRQEARARRPPSTAPNGWSPSRSSTIQSVSGSRPGAGVESRSSSCDAVGASRGHRRRQRGRRVDDEEVAGREELRQVAEASVGDAARPPGGDEQAHAGRVELARASGGSWPRGGRGSCDGAQADAATRSLAR